MTYSHPDRQALVAKIIAAADPAPVPAIAPAPIAFPAASAPVAPSVAAPTASAPTVDHAALWAKAIARVNANIRGSRERGF